MYAKRSTPMESALLTKLGRLPINTRKTKRIRQFNFSRSSVLCWYRDMSRKGRRYSMRCDVAGDGSLEITFSPIRDSRQLHQTKIPRSFRALR